MFWEGGRKRLGGETCGEEIFDRVSRRGEVKESGGVGGHVRRTVAVVCYYVRHSAPTR